MTTYGSIKSNIESEPVIRDNDSGVENTRFVLGSSSISLFKSLTFGWFAPLLTRGNSKDQLDPNDLDLLPLPDSCSTKNVMLTFGTIWQQEVERCQEINQDYSDGTRSKGYKQPSLAWTLARAFGRSYLKAGFLKLIHDICIFVGPIVLHGLIEFLRDSSKELKEGFIMTAAVTVSQLVMSFCLRHYFFECYLTGLRMRTAIVTAVYKKALVLSSTERQNRSSGTIVNLMTIDAQRIQDLTTYGHAVWYSFLQISVALYLLWQQLGASCLGGVGVIFVLVPLNKHVAGWMARLQKKLMEARDVRVEVSSEVLSNMKVIKFQNWEESFQRRILTLRNIELQHLLLYAIGGAASIVLWSAVPLLVALATFTAYTLSGHDLDVASALTALALFDILRFPLFMLPQVINNLVEAGVSLRRVQDFLICDTHKPIEDDGIVGDVGICVDCASFVYDSKKPKLNLSPVVQETNETILKKELVDQEWEIMLLKAQLEDTEEKLKELSGVEKEHLPSEIDDIDVAEQSSGNLLSLRRVNFTCKRGELIAIVGSVGSGKSTFINSFLGEVRAVSGTVSVKGRLSFFPQIPFIMNDSLKNNVIFGHQGEDIDEDKYNRALKVCALEHDLTLMSDGDMTEIGEKGITLSGGQKARVSLARAVYHDSDIYLLDDPIAAVDAHVGKHIFQKCIIDELLLRKNNPSSAEKGKGTVILVTNAIQYLSNPAVDKIVVLDNGCIAETGTYQDLSSKPESIFSSFLSIMAETGLANVEDGLSLGSCDEVYEETGSIGQEGSDVDNNISLSESEEDLSIGSDSINMDADEETRSEMVSPTSPVKEDQSYMPSQAAIEKEDHVSEDHPSPSGLLPPVVIAEETPGMVERENRHTLNIVQDETQRSEESVIIQEERDDELRPLLEENSVPSQNKSEIQVDISFERKRRRSHISEKRNVNKNASTAPLMTNEFQEREKGRVGLDVYLGWAKAAGGWVVVIFVLLGFAIDQVLSISSKWWLTYWSHNSDNGDRLEFLRIYALINLAALIASFIRVLVIVFSGLKASAVLYEDVLDVVLRAPMSFFDTTPIGRIINRFSKDIYTIDEEVVSKLRSFLATISNVIGVMIVISYITPFFTMCLIPIIFFYLRQQMYFTRTYRELKRLDSVSRSPLFALLSETLDGVITIRAYEAEATLFRRIIAMLDTQQNAYFLTCTAQCWLAVRLELVGTLIIFFACICAVLEHPHQAGNEIFVGLAGLSISFALTVTQSLNWSVRMGSDVEASMVSVERIRQYCELPTEAPRHKCIDERLGDTWPSIGTMEFSSVQMRYREGLPLVLKNLDIKIPAMSKIGVVGRTGAGKSTLMVSLLRLQEIESGSILIDGMDISCLGLSFLRSKIAVIPQDPVLFSGTVRTNLDPFNQYDEDNLNEVLERVGLKSGVERVSSYNSLTSLSIGKTLQAKMSLSDDVHEGGTNFSVGQRQLLVIARALLSKAKIVIMDEATASVDADTDSRIQRVMRTDFKEATCITVAHRINTIMDSDYILVMDDGCVAEFDQPKELIRKEGLFKNLIDTYEEENDGRHM